jgi:phage-related baseplate assembly protein
VSDWVYRVTVHTSATSLRAARSTQVSDITQHARSSRDGARARTNEAACGAMASPRKEALVTIAAVSPRAQAHDLALGQLHARLTTSQTITEVHRSIRRRIASVSGSLSAEDLVRDLVTLAPSNVSSS